MKYDLLSTAQTGSRYCVKFLLWPKHWKQYDSRVSLRWNQIKYNKSNIRRLPTSPGVYAFVVKPPIISFDDCNYLMYIGKAVDQTLRVRCRKYLAEIRGRKPRMSIAKLFMQWSPNLFLYYMALDPNHVNISEVENNLLTTFIPPMNTVFPGKLNVIAQEIYK